MASTGTQLRINARTNSVVFDRSRTAVIIVDMQSDFWVCWMSDSATLVAALS